mmetsp:Transcript_3301/g.6855  ORF Transcript_3301/g.6855 Transcript_3301/m.6855 type:complete len:182 (-) Transcript_3301:49-594(-)
MADINCQYKYFKPKPKQNGSAILHIGGDSKDNSKNVRPLHDKFRVPDGTMGNLKDLIVASSSGANSVGAQILDVSSPRLSNQKESPSENTEFKVNLRNVFRERTASRSSAPLASHNGPEMISTVDSRGGKKQRGISGCNPLESLLVNYCFIWDSREITNCDTNQWTEMGGTYEDDRDGVFT